MSKFLHRDFVEFLTRLFQLDGRLPIEVTAAGNGVLDALLNSIYETVSSCC